MTDITAAPHDFRALPILSRDVQMYMGNVRSFQGHRVIDAGRWSRHWRWGAILLLIFLGASIYANALLLPLQKQVPLFLVVREDGTVDTGTQLSDLGQDMAEKVVHASIWRYVQERESYNIADARRRYDLITLMSAKNVQRDYQHWFIEDPSGPQKEIGSKGHIAVQEISVNFVRENVALVRFWREKVKVEGERVQRRSFTATVQFEMLHSAPTSLILDDPAGLQVVRYQVEENSAP